MQIKICFLKAKFFGIMRLGSLYLSTNCLDYQYFEDNFLFPSPKQHWRVNKSRFERYIPLLKHRNNIFFVIFSVVSLLDIYYYWFTHNIKLLKNFKIIRLLLQSNHIFMQYIPQSRDIIE